MHSERVCTQTLTDTHHKLSYANRQCNLVEIADIFINLMFAVPVNVNVKLNLTSNFPGSSPKNYHHLI